MSAGEIQIQLDSPEARYLPGETLSGVYRIPPALPEDLHTVEVSAYWFTEGKGDEDLGSHFFEKRSRDDAAAVLAPDVEGVFSLALPACPLSYDGVLIKVRWCVRVRAICVDGRQFVGAVEFRLGEVGPVSEVTA
jgi:hypothetical protein